MTTLHIQIVISKYKEDIDWIKKCIENGVQFTIYDKSDTPMPGSLTLKNVGREAETLLHHIFNNYESLPDFLVFLQGDPRGTPPMYQYEDAVRIVTQVYKKQTSIKFSEILTGRFYVDPNHIWTKKAKSLCHALFGSTNINYWTSSGAQYILPRENILARPKRLYELLLSRVHDFGHNSFDANDPSMNLGIDAWTLEAVWGAIFNPEIELVHNFEKRLFTNLGTL